MKLNPEAAALYRAANAAYLSGNHKLAFIQIHSGRRASKEQALLFVKSAWCQWGGPDANRANSPGKSRHEFGLAIDIVRGNDEKALKRALETAGWLPTHEDEGWHFDAMATDAWKAASDFIRFKSGPLSEDYRKMISDFFGKRKVCIELWPSYKRQLQKLQPERQKLEGRRGQLVREERWLRTTRATLASARRKLDQREQELTRLRRKLSEMRYTACPNKEPYESCTHEDLKAQYDREKRQREVAVERASKACTIASTKYQADLNAFERRRSRYEKDLIDFKLALEQWEARNKDFVRLERRLQALRGEMDVLGKGQRVLLGRIEALVNSHSVNRRTQTRARRANRKRR